MRRQPQLGAAQTALMEDVTMAGGHFNGSRRRCARELSAGLLSGLLLSPWAPGMTTAFAADAAASSGAAQAADAADQIEKPRLKRRNERSIIVDDEAETAAAETADGSETTDVEQAADVADAANEDVAASIEPVTSASDYADEVLPEPADDAPGAWAEDGADDSAEAASDEPEGDADEFAEESNIESTPTNVHEAVAMQAASFNGVVPGETTRKEIIKQWGEPASKTKSGDSFTYEFKSFPSVEVNFERDTVASIRVELFEPVSAENLATKLGLTAVQPAQMQNPDGTCLGTWFPERGVAFMHRPALAAALATDDNAPSSLPEGEDAVYEIELTRIEAAPFLLRAETASAADRSQQIADLETALRLDPAGARARARLSSLRLAAGQAINAEKLAAEAVQLEPRNDEYRLAWAKCLKHLAQYDAAVREARTVLEGPHATPMVRAQALEQMGLLASLGSKEVQARSVPLHNKAIALADELTKSQDPAVRIAATQLLVDAHLAVAERIAAGQWKNKDDAVGNWIARASGLAEEMIANGEADVSLRLQVAVSALAAGARLDPPIDPSLWIAEAEQTVSVLHARGDDPAAHAEIDWQMGLAYYYATEIQHQRGRAESALKYGNLAEATLTPLADARAEFPDTDYVLGRLCFQIGAVHAVHNQDHATACEWYDRAAESLMRPVPVTELAGPKAHGDALVSMGVSYWEIGQKDRAYDLTKAGVELVEQGVAEKLLAADAIDVPQHNLDAMNRALGKVETAASQAPAQQVAEVPTNTPPKRATRPTSRSQQRMASRRNAESSSTRRR